MRRNRWNIAGPLLLLSALAGCREGVVSPAAGPIEAPQAAAPAPMSARAAGPPHARPRWRTPRFRIGRLRRRPERRNLRRGKPRGGVPGAVGLRSGDEQLRARDVGCIRAPRCRRRSACTPKSVASMARLRWTSRRRFASCRRTIRHVGSGWSCTRRRPSAARISPDSTFCGRARSARRRSTRRPTDSSLRTYVDTWQGISLRRIKHFSGYIIGADRSCDPATQECP